VRLFSHICLPSKSHKNGTENIHTFPLQGGDILKFGDIIIAVASLVVLVILISFPLTLVLTPALGNLGGFMLSAIIAFLLSAIIVGYIFAQNIWEENRTKTIAKIAILFTVLAISLIITEMATVEWAPMFRAEYLKANPTATPSAFDWYYIQRLQLIAEDFILVVFMFALSFIGLYISSMLKKPAKT